MYCIKIVLVIVAAIVSFSIKEDAQMVERLIEVRAICRDEPECFYDGIEMPIQVIISNVGSDEVGIALSFLQRSGPIVRVVQHSTRAETFARRNLADHALKEDIVTMWPGGNVTLDWVLMPEELEQFGPDVDVDVDVIIQADVVVGGSMIPVTASDTLRIVTRPMDSRNQQ